MGQTMGKSAAGDKKGGKTGLKKPVKKIDRNLIGKPTNFQHTGHIGIGDMRNPDFDPEKVKTQMASIAAKINLDDDDEAATGDKPATSEAKPPSPDSAASAAPPVPAHADPDTRLAGRTPENNDKENSIDE